jgi:hypothetical protein
LYVGRDFYPAEPDESLVYAFDFVNDLGVGGEKLVSAVWSISITQGDDPQVMHRLQGAPFIFTTQGNAVPTATMQRIGGLQPGVTYCVRALVITSDTDQRSLWSHIQGVAII